MTEPAAPPTAPAPPIPAPKPAERHEVPFGRAFLFCALVFGVAAAAKVEVLGAVAPIAAGLGFLVTAASRGVLRSQPLIMAEVTWLVLAVILKLVFLEDLPAAPMVVFCAVLLVQYFAQLGVDLKAFAAPGAETETPPVTYAVTFALAPAICIGAQLFRAARANYSAALGVFLAMTLAASVFLLLVVWWDWTRKAFSSLKMAVTLLSLIGLGSVVGTFVIQKMPEESVQKHYEKFMNGEGAAPVNARYLFQDPTIEWTDADEARRVAMNEKFGSGLGDRWAIDMKRARYKAAKEAEGTRFVSANREALHSFYEFCDDTELTRIFKSWYFNALLVLLAATVVGVMARRRPYDGRDAGWVVTHSGIVTLLLFLAGSDLFVRDGFIEMSPTAEPGGSGRPSDVKAFDDMFLDGRSRDFPWTVRLVRTSADWYQQLQVTFLDEQGQGVAAEQYPVLAGKVVELERPSKDAPPRYRIEMLEALERADVSASYRKAERPTGGVVVGLLADDGRDVWLDDDATAVEGGKLRRVVAKDAADVARWTAPQMPGDVGEVGFVRVLDRDTRELAKLPATAGATAEFDFEGKRWTARVADVALDPRQWLAERDTGTRTPVEKQFPGTGLAIVELSVEGGAPQRTIAMGGRDENFDDDHGKAGPGAATEAGLRVKVETIAPIDVRLVVAPDGAVTRVRERRGVVETTALREGDVVETSSDGKATVRLGKVIRDAETHMDVRPLPEESDEDYMKNGLAGRNEQIGRPALKVRVTEGDGAPYEQWLVGGDPWLQPTHTFTRDGRVVLILGNGIESMYRSALQAIDSKGNVLGEHVVRVNTPFRMDGYEFYQNNFARPDQGGPLSTFRVKYDLFVPWIYAGFALVSIGVIVMLWFPGQRAFKLHAHLARLPEEGPKESR